MFLLVIVILEMKEFDIIKWMSWLSPYHVILDCWTKIVTVAMPLTKKLEWKGTFNPTPMSCIKYSYPKVS